MLGEAKVPVGVREEEMRGGEGRRDVGGAPEVRDGAIERGAAPLGQQKGRELDVGVGDLGAPQRRVRREDAAVAPHRLVDAAALDVQPPDARERGDPLPRVLVQSRRPLVVRDRVGHPRHPHERLR